jgi:ATP-dependent DNA helicase RecQ
LSIRDRAIALLRKATGDPDAAFRDDQLESVVHLVESKKRLLVVQRTGWGKSMVYFIATALLREDGAGPTLLISPLLALMRDQLRQAERIGIRPATINSSNREEWQQIEQRIRRGEIDLLLISPERLANDEFVSNILGPITQSIGMFVVDEAHCISDWGHDFRPDYRRITRILNFLPPGIPLLATTATANDRVVNDVAAQLGPTLTVIRGPLRRDSLRLQNIRLGNQAERLAWLAEHIPKIPGAGIIYTLTVRDAQRVAGWLKYRGIDAEAYWGDLDNEMRLELEHRLLSNQLKAVVATSALGMGFDKRDLGFVVHYQRPGSVIHYYQQVGRAGRAIDDALGILLSGDEDDDIAGYFINTAFASEEDIVSVLGTLEISEAGLTLDEIGARVNVRRGAVEKVLKNLSVDSPAPVVHEKSRWRRTPISYVHDSDRVARITALRRSEQTRMSEYVVARSCLMAFLSEELDDADVAPCGRVQRARAASFCRRWLPPI